MVIIGSQQLLETQLLGRMYFNSYCSNAAPITLTIVIIQLDIIKANMINCYIFDSQHMYIIKNRNN